MAAQSTLSGSTETNGAAVGEGEGSADGLGDAAEGFTLPGAPLSAAEPLGAADAPAASEPEGTAPSETVTTAVTVRRVPVSDPHPETINSSPADAAASTR